MEYTLKKWTEYLEAAVYTRLCECRNIRSDLSKLVNARWLYYKEIGKDTQGYTKEDALVDILDILDSNSQYIDLTQEEYNALSK